MVTALMDGEHVNTSRGFYMVDPRNLKRVNEKFTRRLNNVMKADFGDKDALIETVQQDVQTELELAGETAH